MIRESYSTAGIAGMLLMLLPCLKLPALPYPDSIAAWGDTEKASQREAGHAMLRQIQEAGEQGLHTVKIAPGNYRFDKTTNPNRPTHIDLYDLKNLTIDFQGSTLWFETEASGIAIRRAENLTLKNVILDWDPLPFTQGVVTAIYPEQNAFDVRIDAGYQYVVDGMRTRKPVQGGWRGVLFDPLTRMIKEDQVGFSVGFEWNNKNADGTYRVAYGGFYNQPISRSGMEVGDAIAILKRMHRAIRSEAGVGTTFDNVTIYSSPFVAFSHGGGEAKSVVFRGCKIVRRPGTDRLLSSNADGINISNSNIGPVIEDCIMDALGDDFINVHGHLSRVVWQISPTEIICSRLNFRTISHGPVEIEFLERESMKSLGRRTVTGGELVSWPIERDHCLANLDHHWHSGEAAALAYGKTMWLQKLTLDEPLTLTKDVVIACEQFSGAGAMIRNNHMSNSLALGIRMQSPGALIENNHISYTIGPAISLQGFAAYWGEGPYVHDVVVRNNTIEYGGLGSGIDNQCAIRIVDGDYKNIRLARNLVIENNSIFDSPGPAIIARGVEKLKLIGNTVQNCCYRNVPVGTDRAIILENVGGLVKYENSISNSDENVSEPTFEKVTR